MNARLVAQHNPETGETNLCFLTDPVASVEDALVTAGSWARATVTVEPVTIVASDAAMAILGQREFRCVDDTAGEAGFEVVDEDALRRLVDDALRPDDGPPPPIGL